MNQPCIFHSKEGFPSRHTTGQCQSLKKIEKVRRNGNNNGNDNNSNTRGPDPQQARNDDPGFGREVGSLHTFIGLDNRRERRSSHEQSLATPSPQTPLATSTGPSSQSAGAAKTTPAGSNTPGGAPS